MNRLRTQHSFRHFNPNSNIFTFVPVFTTEVNAEAHMKFCDLVRKANPENVFDPATLWTNPANASLFEQVIEEDERRQSLKLSKLGNEKTNMLVGLADGQHRAICRRYWMGMLDDNDVGMYKLYDQLTGKVLKPNTPPALIRKVQISIPSL
jgi:hypothetical protein